jgi:GDP-L-fucose synthase
MADACVYLFENLEANDLYSRGISHINIGSGWDLTIGDLARTVADITEFQGEIVFDASKPDGVKRKLLDVSVLNNLGWKSQIDLKQGIQLSYEWYRENYKNEF